MKLLLSLIYLCSSSILLAETVSFHYNDPQYTAYAKNAMVAGAVTATTVGYSALRTNPAGLAESTSYVGYSSGGNSLNMAKEILFGKSITASYSESTLALGTGFEFGNFFVGATAVNDMQTSSSQYSDGNHYILGSKYKYTHTDVDSYWKLQFGASYKSSGQNQTDDGTIFVSPKKLNIGLSAETNLKLFQSTLQVSYDNSSETFDSISEQINGNAIGVKWLLSRNLALALGQSTKTYTGNAYISGVSDTAMGLELAYKHFGVNVSLTTTTQTRLDTVSVSPESYALLDFYYYF